MNFARFYLLAGAATTIYFVIQLRRWLRKTRPHRWATIPVAYMGLVVICMSAWWLALVVAFIYAKEDEF